MNVFKRAWTYLFNKVEHNPIEPGDEGEGAVSQPTRVDVHSASGERSFEIVKPPAKSTKAQAKTYPAKPKAAARKKSNAKKSTARKKKS